MTTLNGHHNGHHNGNGNGNGKAHTNRIADLVAGSMPPHSIEAERGVLGSVLIDPGVLPAVREVIDPGDIYREAHRLILEAILAMADRGTPVDGLLLIEELRRRGHLDRIGGEVAIEALPDAAPHAANATHYAGIIREHAARRRMIELAGRLLADGHGADLTAGQMADRVRGELDVAAATDPSRPGPVLTRLSDVAREEIAWLWPGRVPLGMLTLLCGDPGTGKSFLTMAMAATVSVGGAWPDSAGEGTEPGSVIVLSAEDHLACTIRPRLDAAGADPSRVHSLSTVRQRGGKLSPFRLARDLPALEQACDRVGDVRLVVIDPVSAYLGGADEHKNAEVRGLLGPLNELAERRGLAVLMVTHLNKGSGTKAVYRSTGSLAFAAAARLTWLAIRDPDDRARRLLLPSKVNPVAEPTGLAYRIADGAVQWEPEPVQMHADDALTREGERGDGAGKRGERGPVPEKTQACMHLVTARLRAGRCRLGVLRRVAEDAGYGASTLYAALRALALEAQVEDGVKWYELSKAPDEEGPVF